MTNLIDKIDEIRPIEALDLYKVREILTSNKITQTQKIQFIRENREQIKDLAKEKITSEDFKIIMSNRPLKLLKPLKNGYTKVGDRKLLAIALGISPIKVNNYIDNLTHKLRTMDNLETLGISKDVYEEIKTYVFRHGTKEQVIDILDYELHHAKNILETLYSTLTYNSCGVADYFMRPIHRLDNKTMLNVYSTIDKNLKTSYKEGKLTEAQALKNAEWALAKIYEIQNNQRLKNVIKLKNELE